MLRELYVLDTRPIITGEYLIDARPNTDPVDGNVVTFTLNNEGARRFKNETAKHLKENMAIVLDDKVITAPIIQSAIGRNGQITVGGDLQTAQDLALVLRAGALPGAAQDHRSAEHRREPRPGLHRQGHPRARDRRCCSWSSS